MNNENKTEHLQSKSEDLQLMVQKVGETAGLVKLICGVCNNAAHLLALGTTAANRTAKREK